MLDESIHKSAISFGFDGADTKGKEAAMVVSTNNPGPTFNNGEAGMLSTMVLITRITLTGVVSPCTSMVSIVAITLAGVVSLADHDKSFGQPSQFSLHGGTS